MILKKIYDIFSIFVFLVLFNFSVSISVHFGVSHLRLDFWPTPHSAAAAGPTGDGVAAVLQDPSGTRFPAAPWDGAEPLSAADAKLLALGGRQVAHAAVKENERGRLPGLQEVCGRGGRGTRLRRGGNPSSGRRWGGGRVGFCVHTRAGRK